MMIQSRRSGSSNVIIKVAICLILATTVDFAQAAATSLVDNYDSVEASNVQPFFHKVRQAPKKRRRLGGFRPPDDSNVDCAMLSPFLQSMYPHCQDSEDEEEVMDPDERPDDDGIRRSLIPYTLTVGLKNRILTVDETRYVRYVVTKAMSKALTDNSPFYVPKPRKSGEDSSSSDGNGSSPYNDGGGDGTGTGGDGQRLLRGSDDGKYPPQLRFLEETILEWDDDEYPEEEEDPPPRRGDWGYGGGGYGGGNGNNGAGWNGGYGGGWNGGGNNGTSNSGGGESTSPPSDGGSWPVPAPQPSYGGGSNGGYGGGGNVTSGGGGGSSLPPSGGDSWPVPAPQPSYGGGNNGGNETNGGGWNGGWNGHHGGGPSERPSHNGNDDRPPPDGGCGGNNGNDDRPPPDNNKPKIWLWRFHTSASDPIIAPTNGEEENVMLYPMKIEFVAWWRKKNKAVEKHYVITEIRRATLEAGNRVILNGELRENLIEAIQWHIDYKPDFQDGEIASWLLEEGNLFFLDPTEDTLPTYLYELDTDWGKREWAGLLLLGLTLLVTFALYLFSICKRSQPVPQGTHLLTEDGVRDLLTVGWSYEKQKDGSQLFLKVFDKSTMGYGDDDSVLDGGVIEKLVISEDQAAPTAFTDSTVPTERDTTVSNRMSSGDGAYDASSRQRLSASTLPAEDETKTNDNEGASDEKSASA